MIKETDASKNDERRVQNKLNPLTHKKKGETHTMGSQGMKIWKLGVFFVISLMLVAGLFSDSASAQLETGTVSVQTTPPVIVAEDVVNVTFTYTFNSTLALADSSSQIGLPLPTGWEAAQGSFSVVEEAPEDNTATTDTDESMAAYIIVKLGTMVITINTDIDGDAGSITASAAINGNVTFNYGGEATEASALLGGKKLVVTYYNVEVESFTAIRSDRFTDIDVEDVAATMTVDESTQQAATFMFTDPDGSDDDTDNGAKSVIIAVNRRTLGMVSISPSEFDAGSRNSLTITYTFREAMDSDGIIDIVLPYGWGDGLLPRVYGVGQSKPSSSAKVPDIYTGTGDSRMQETNGYVFLGTLSSDLKGTRIITTTPILSPVDSEEVPIAATTGGLSKPDGTQGADADGNMVWVIQIAVVDNTNEDDDLTGEKIQLVYRNVSAPRTMGDADIAVFSSGYNDDLSIGTTDADGFPTGLASSFPRYPAATQRSIMVDSALSGSGMVMVGYNNDGTDAYNLLMPLAKNKKETDGPEPNSIDSIPAGSVADDNYHLQFTYTPVGDMGGGKLELRIPNGWTVVDENIDYVLDGGAATGVRSKNTRTGAWEFELTADFGEKSGDKARIFLKEVGAPNRHGNQPFTVRTKNSGTGFRELDEQPQVFVGNAMASNDTMEVTIEPLAVYQGETEVDFTITLKANGPMYDSDVRIGVGGLVTPVTEGTAVTSASPGYVHKKFSPTAKPPEVVDGNIIIRINKLDTNKSIKVFYNNVDLDGTVAGVPFTVATRTRTSDDFASDSYVQIDPDDDDVGGIKGGEIRSVAGSGKMATNRPTVEKSSSNNTFSLTYTAVTDLVDVTLRIVAPPVITTELSETSAIGKVDASSSDRKKLDVEESDDELVVENNTIIWSGLTLKEGKTFVTNIRRVAISDETGAYEWVSYLADAEDEGQITDDPNTDASEIAPLAVLGKSDDVAFEIVDEYDSASVDPGYAASSKQQILFQFTMTNTAIQEGGSIWFTVPGGWSSADVADKKDITRVAIVADDGSLNEKIDEGKTLDLDASGRKFTLKVGENGLEADSTVTIQYGTDTHPAIISPAAKGDPDEADDGLSIKGYYRASKGLSQRSAGTIWVDVTNVLDGAGSATLTSDFTIRAGSKNNLIKVEFTGVGTMDGGAVRLTRPDDWGDMQLDPLKLNHVKVDVSGGASLADDDPVETENDGESVVVTLKDFDDGDKLTFLYGGGTGSDANKGAVAQDEIGMATFIIESMGKKEEDEGEFQLVEGIKPPDPLPETDFPVTVYNDNIGALEFEVKGAESGSGEVTVKVEKSKTGVDAIYAGAAAGADGQQIHAGDDSTYLLFTYKPDQTIGDGQLRFTVPGTWTDPHDESTDDPGYTRIEGVDGAQVGSIQFDPDKPIITAGISLTQDQSIKIHYGEGGGEGGAVAPAVADDYSFGIAIRGTSDPDDEIKSIPVPAVKVRAQRSGGGSAYADVTDSKGALYAGDMGREVTITYEATGQIVNGQLKLTIPAEWSAPMVANFEVKTKGTGASVEAMADMEFGGDLPEDELEDRDDISGMDVLVDDVVLKKGQKVMFVYKNVAVQQAVGSPAFAVAVDGGEGPDSADGPVPMAVAVPEDKSLAVSVREARPGSGTIDVDTDGAILAGSTGNTLTFTYTAAGQISTSLTEFRVIVDEDWSKPIAGGKASDKKGTYSITHLRGFSEYSTIVEKIAPIDYDMIARVKSGASPIMGGDTIEFEYQNADAPADAETSVFKVEFAGQTLAVGSAEVLVQAADADQIALTVPSSVSVDEGAARAKVTVMIQDANGDKAAADDDVEVTFETSSKTGTFALTATGAGEAELSITVKQGAYSAPVYYSDSAAGTTARITASTDNLGSDAETIAVSSDVVSIGPVSFAISDGKDVAMDGDTVTVTADISGAPSETPTFTIGTTVVPSNGGGTDMTDADGDGTYAGRHTLAPGSAEGSHDVTVHVAGAEPETRMADSMLVIDNTMPSVTITAPAADTTVADGDTVTISATVVGATSVMADVSALDLGVDPVKLTDADSDGTYAGTHTISKDNGALNGSKTITVTATDAAGNEGEASVMVTLDNMLSFTSMIPAGTSLFHVPLDDDDISTVGALKTELGAAVNFALVLDSTSGWDSRSDDVAITADLGIVLSMNAEASVTFTGDAWGGGTSTISLSAGDNLIGLPINDPRVTNVSDIAGLFGSGVVQSIVVATGDSSNPFVVVIAAGDAGNGPVMGDAGYLVKASTAGTAALIGSAWTNSAGTSAAPIALAGYNVEGQTAVLDVQGAVVDEITGLSKESFRVKVKNLSTKAALSSVSSVEAADGYNMTFVDLKAGNAARIGDVLEISADSPNPLIGVKPVRHIVTVDDVKNSAIQLENLIAYEIPAETELLRNYPNPFNPETWIPYHLSEDADVKLTIYDINGEMVRDIDVGHQTAAKYDTRAKAIYWDGRNRFGEQVASGIYFYHLDAGDFSGTRKMVILK